MEIVDRISRALLGQHVGANAERNRQKHIQMYVKQRKKIFNQMHHICEQHAIISKEHCQRHNGPEG